MSLQDLLKEAKAAEVADKSGNSLFLCLLGPSGAGKNHAIGTTGLKTLLITFMGESHGVKSSRKEGGDNIIPFFVDYVNDATLDPDQTLARLRSVLSNPQALVDEGFKVIALDGMSELDICINNSNELKKQCMTKMGKVDGFKTAGATKSIGNGIVKTLLSLQRQTGIHVLTTCIVDVREFGDRGEVIDCAPRLSTYGFAESMLQMFADRVVVGPQTINDERVYVFDSLTDLARASKTESGVVKKAFNFSPRLSSGVLPPIMRADLSKLIEIKEKG